MHFKTFGAVFSAAIVLLAAQLHALTISDVSYTSNSVTFTVDGDLDGYSMPTASRFSDYFSLRYSDDMLDSGLGYSEFYANTWTGSLFDVASFVPQSNGFSGSFSSNGIYTWSGYGSDLSDATFSGSAVTVTFGGDILDVTASNPIISFYWGSGGVGNAPILLASVEALAVEPLPVDPLPAVPLPAGLPLLASGLAGLFGIRRLRKAA